MNRVLRLITLLMVMPATYFFVYWLTFSLVSLGENRWIANAVSLLCALMVGGYVSGKLATAPNGAVTSTLLGALILGGIGFAAGFYGPLIFMPEAIQAPLFGIYVACPLGFLLGGTMGFLYWYIRSRKERA